METARNFFRTYGDADNQKCVLLSGFSSHFSLPPLRLIRLKTHFFLSLNRMKKEGRRSLIGSPSDGGCRGLYVTLMGLQAYLEKTLVSKGTARNGTIQVMISRPASLNLENLHQEILGFFDFKKIGRKMMCRGMVTVLALSSWHSLSAAVLTPKMGISLQSEGDATVIQNKKSLGRDRSKRLRGSREVPSEVRSERMPIGHLLEADARDVEHLEEIAQPPALARELPRELKSSRLEPGPLVRVEIPPEGGEPHARLIDPRQVPSGIQVAVESPRDKLLSLSDDTSQKEVSPPVASVLTIVQNSDSGALEMTPSTISLQEPGQVVEVRFHENIDPILLSQTRVFVRNTQIAQLVKGTKNQAPVLTIKSLTVGKTEAYLITDRHMTIVPIEVQSSALVVKAKDDQGLFRPLLLASHGVSLSEISAVGGHEASYARDSKMEEDARVRLDDLVDQLQDAELQEKATSGADAPRDGEHKISDVPAITASRQGSRLNQSVQETEQFLQEQAQQQAPVASEPEEFDTVDIALQVVDDRTPGESLSVKENRKSPIYPVVGVRVEIPGTEFQGVTDSMGYLVIKGVPRHSEILARVSDTSGVMVSTVAELKATADVQRVVMHRTFAYDIAQNLAGVSQSAQRGSLCASIQSPPGIVNRYTVETLGVESDVHYVNHNGVIDSTLKNTDILGKFCIFNLNPGPLAIAVSTDDRAQEGRKWTFSLGVYGAVHQNIVLPLEIQETSFRTRLVSVATAHEQLSTDPTQSSQLKKVDFTEAYPLGTSIPMGQPEMGHLESEAGLDFYAGSSQIYVEAQEFENTIYMVKAGETRGHVTPLIPKGFIDDMALYAHVVRDQRKGTVLAEFAHYRGISAPVNIKLVDVEGQVVGNSWYFGDHPVTKALFFNVDPGRYSLVVETREGDWLASEIVNVYSETSSYLRLGERLSDKTS